MTDSKKQKNGVNADNLLRESEEKYRTLVESSPFGVLVIQDGCVVFTNQALAHMIGVKNPADYVGGDALVFVPENEKPRLRAFMEARVAGERDVPTHYESRLMRVDGSEFPVEISTAVITMKGRPAIQVIVSDMTDRVRAEQSEREARNYLQTIVETSHDGILVLDSLGHFEFANGACITIFGWPEKEIIGEHFIKVIAPDHHDFIMARWDEAQRGQGGSYEVDIVTKENERRHLLVSHRHMEVSGKRKYCVFVKDVSDRKRMEEEVRLAQKMQAVGQLAGGIAHDFNNLLTAVMGFGQIASKNIDAENPVQEDLAEILLAAGRAEQLTGQLLALGRRQTMTVGPIDVNEVILNMDKLLQQAVGGNVELVIEFGEDVWAVEADPGYLEQVLLNLAVNARDAMPEGGTLSVTVGNLSIAADDHVLPQQDLKPGDYVRLLVEDTGQGMSNSVAERIFEPFFTTKDEGEGSGLGLSTAYGIIRQFGGHITVQTEPGVGSIFSILLPRSLKPVDYVQQIESSADIKGGEETLLIVDDDRFVRVVTTRMLKALGYTVLEAPNGIEALEVATTYDGRIDLVLTDVLMPLMAGPELIDNLERVITGFKTLYMSGFNDRQREFKNEKPVRLLRKPFKLAQLAGAVRDALDDQKQE